MKNQINGLLVVNKPQNLTSRDVVNKICKILNTKAIGHIGTLDPMASGVLVCLIGKYTKLSNIMVNHDKEYEVTFKLGILTDTLDITGNVLSKSNKQVSKEEIINTITSFIGTYNQEVPKYSAVKVNGKKLYEYARNNEEVILPKKEVTIYNISNININEEITFNCKVSKGTYIRSLVRDIGNKLGTYATMTSLIRTSLDKFTIKDSYSIEDIENNNYKLLNLKDFLDLETINIDNQEELKRILNGNIINKKYNKYVLFKYENKSVALYQPYEEKIKPLIIF